MNFQVMSLDAQKVRRHQLIFVDFSCHLFCRISLTRLFNILRTAFKNAITRPQLMAWWAMLLFFFFPFWEIEVILSCLFLFRMHFTQNPKVNPRLVKHVSYILMSLFIYFFVLHLRNIFLVSFRPSFPGRRRRFEEAAAAPFQCEGSDSLLTSR